MRFHSSQISIILITLGFFGCFEAPEFSEVPKIKFNSLVFNDSISSRTDALILKFDFEDGDGNIGLFPTETFVPFHPFNFVIDSRDSLVTYSDISVLPPLYTVDFSGRVQLFSQEDNRPFFNCSDYQLTNSDTIYIQKNEFHNNLHIAFERKRNGVYSEIDFGSEFSNSNCSETNFDGRIIVFEEDNLGEPLTGTISYSMNSVGFPIIFRNDTARLTLYIYDRDLNKSNVIQTPDFTLPSITVEIE